MRIVIADDAVLLREGLVSILREEGNDVVAAVGTGPALLAAGLALRPDLVIADVRMPPTHTDDGIVAVRELRRRHPGLPSILLSQHIQASAAIELFQEDSAALGYLLKDRVVQIDDFLDAVRRVAAGGAAVDPAVIARLLGKSAATERTSDQLANLTEREREVLSLMAQGLSNSAIGAGLHLGVRTVETHTSAVFMKLGLAATADEHRRVRAVLAYLDSERE